MILKLKLGDRKKDYNLEVLTVKELKKCMEGFDDDDLVVFTKGNRKSSLIKYCNRKLYSSARNCLDDGDSFYTYDLEGIDDPTRLDENEYDDDVFEREVIEADYDFTRPCLSLETY